MLFIVVLSLTNYQVEEIATNENSIKTVSKEEAMLFLQQQGNTINLNGNSTSYDYNFRKITQEKLTNTAELLTVVPIITKLKKTKSKALLIKVASKIQTIIYTEYHEESSKTNSFSDTILLTKLNGDFIRAYKLKNNEYVIDLILANTPNSKFLNVNSFELNEVIIINSYKKPSWGYVPIIFQDTQTTPSISDLENYWWLRSGGDGGIAEDSDPCDELQKQILNSAYQAKIQALKNKTGLKNETGFVENKNGTYIDLKNSSNNSLDLLMDANIIGFNHTHIDDYDSGKKDADGNPIIMQPIKIFSPKDVMTFLIMINYANSQNLSLSTIYGIVITTFNIYTLKFEGVISDLNLKIAFDSKLNNQYIKTIKRNGIEKGFLKFLNDNNIKGVALYKKNKDGTNQKQSIDADNRLIQTPCN